MGAKSSADPSAGAQESRFRRRPPPVLVDEPAHPVEGDSPQPVAERAVDDVRDEQGGPTRPADYVHDVVASQTHHPDGTADTETRPGVWTLAAVIRRDRAQLTQEASCAD
jgi:hypothetical protein